MSLALMMAYYVSRLTSEATKIMTKHFKDQTTYPIKKKGIKTTKKDVRPGF